MRARLLRYLAGHFFHLAVHRLPNGVNVGHLRVEADTGSATIFHANHQRVFAGMLGTPRHRERVVAGGEMKCQEAPGVYVSQRLRSIEQPSKERLLAPRKQTGGGILAL